LGRHEWAQLRERIPVAEYAKLKDQFTAENFNAREIVAFAKKSGMKYINITTRHHDCFCLWNTKETDFNSVNSPAKRDLVAELAEACRNEGIGFFLYYSHGRDWKHPHAPDNADWGGQARPLYETPEPTYKTGAEHNLNLYLEFMKNQVKELLTLVPDAAGIWLDGVAVPLSRDHAPFKLQEFYDHVHSLSPHALVSYKQGVLGTEDFFTSEHYLPTASDTVEKRGQIKSGRMIEINTTMIDDPISWGYNVKGTHKNFEQVWAKLEEAKRINSNFLLNTGPMADGSLDPKDTEVLLAVGAKLAETDFWNS
jgi:alpha-L-fucosidase